MPSPIEVVAAVLQRPGGAFLLAQRPAGKVYQGYWEFPGGKVEPGEAPPSALSRELHEELGINVTRAWPWIVREYVYPHGHVRLNFFRVHEWREEPSAREAQALSWQHLDDIQVEPLLPANGPVLRSLALPPVLAITNAHTLGDALSLERLAGALNGGLRFVMVREKEMSRERLLSFARRVNTLATSANAIVVLNGDEDLARTVGVNGIHMPAGLLMRVSARPDFAWCGGSCHNERELEHAARLGLDYVLLGPVNHTPTHTEVTPLGWERFRSLVNRYPLPVYALGGIRLSDFEIACDNGAHGVAMIRGAWQAAPAHSFPSDWSGSGSAVGIR